MIIQYKCSKRPEEELKEAIVKGHAGVLFRLKSTAMRAIRDIEELNLEFFINETNGYSIVSWKLPQ